MNQATSVLSDLADGKHVPGFQCICAMILVTQYVWKEGVK